ncbi:shikimate kinase [Kitasatospora sp. NBC_01287]|uniref:shikimate kinase n=1 Tax=Kitasatospora sp. NBC_01287 TaxID=2903573 RepID=UPI00224E1D86|nr:shikimate kinase [Kitasatospora sp. NBC_01287]MCX4745105.1 shikimate kinase [Kitasatospora sp. NBC_01287]
MSAAAPTSTAPDSTAPAGPLAVLVGPPGAGKSTVGRLLAERLGCDFRDTDADIERRAGKPIPEIFIEDGEPHFRVLEAQAVAAALAEHQGVLALGGGAVLADATRALLAGRPVVFLEVALHDAVKRVGLDAPRPLLAINPRQQWRELMERRRPLYLEVAAATVATEGLTPEQVADAVLESLDLTSGPGVEDA